MEDDKRIIKTNFGLSGNEEVEITFYKSLKGKEEARIAAESLHKASKDLHILMISIEKVNPEYCQKLLDVRREINSLRHDLLTQFNGYIQY